MNPNSTVVAKDNIRIVHDPSQRHIYIYFISKLEKYQDNNNSSSSRYCKQPQLVGRLSGTSVLKLSWTKKLRKESSFRGEEEIEVLTGTYRVPQAGKYFLEIIVNYCEELSFESFNGKVCIEDPDSNRLTDEGVL